MIRIENKSGRMLNVHGIQIPTRGCISVDLPFTDVLRRMELNKLITVIQMKGESPPVRDEPEPEKPVRKRGPRKKPEGEPEEVTEEQPVEDPLAEDIPEEPPMEEPE